VLQHLDGFLSRELGTFLLVGKSKPLVIYELLCGMEEATEQQSRLCQLFAEALRAYRSQAWEEAITAFYTLTSSTIFKEDGPSHFYARLCEQYRARPPGVRWDGVVRITSK
jgi:adenylate cyclase